MSTTKDTISKIKEQEEKTKTTQIINKEEEYVGSDDEENQKTKGAVEEQASTTSNKPKSLADILNAEAGDKKVKPKQIQKTEKVQNKPPEGKMFYNSKKISSNEPEHNKQTQKKTFTGKVGEGSKQFNDSIKKTKDYTEKEIQKSYKNEEDVAKPEFKSKKDGQNFVELNQKEDVSISYTFIYVLFIIVQLLAKNIAEHKFEFKQDYNDDTKKAGEHVEKKKKNHHKKQNYVKEEIANDVDSDGFEITGTKEKKKENLPKKPKHYKQHNEGKKKWHKKREDKQTEETNTEQPNGEQNEAPVNKMPETQTAEVNVGAAKSLKDLLG